jgi:MoxR-like ATPase
MTSRFPCPPGEPVRLVSGGQVPEQVHVFGELEVQALEVALAAYRPLLIRGEPGVGKTQLAKAAAVALKRAYVPFVVDSRTEAADLLWHFDAVARLAEAQLQGALGAAASDAEALREQLAVENFIQPRALWWAFDWPRAAKQARRCRTPEPPQLKGCDPRNGAVVLVDEIDKAETDVPNGLLEALGAGQFTPQGITEPVTVKGHAPLVLITTNEERALPDAFLRRCLVLHLALPTARDDLIVHLVLRAKAHFKADDTVLERAAELLADDRARAREQQWLPLPGQAEYLDLIRAVLNLKPGNPKAQRALLDRIAGFALRKHPRAAA